MVNVQIKKYRTQIMGIAAIGVLLVHSNGIVDWHPLLKKLFGFGGTGVYVFVFLSAIGLYNSLKVRGGGVQQVRVLQKKICKVNSTVRSDCSNVVWNTGYADRRKLYSVSF